MALASSPGIVTNGLVFCYDMYNTLKSFKGAPTTNQVSSAASFSGWNNYWRTDYINTFTTEFGTTGYRITGNPSWNGLYRTFNLGSTGTYTFSAWFRYWGGTGNNNGATVYVSNYGGGDTAAGIDKSKVGIWQRISHTVNVTSPSNVYLYFISYGGDSTGRSDCSTWDITMPQVEAGSFATGFVDGTRSSTQALFDLTGQNTVTASSLTYNNDGTFTIAGASNYISITNSSILRPSTELTIEYIIKGSAPGSWTPILGYGNGDYTNGNYLVWVETGGALNSLCRINNGGVTEYRQYPGYSISSSNFQHMCFTMRIGDAIRSYRNGVDTNTPTSLPSGGAFYYGGTSSAYQVGGSGGTWLNATVPLIRIYNRALSASEAAQNFAAQRGLYGI